MADDYVIDTNVWVEVNKTIADIETRAELDCVETCRKWLQAFMAGDDRLVIDNTYAILREYRLNVNQSNQLAYEWLNSLQRAPRHKLVEVHIRFDSNGHAIIPFDFDDEDDRKFIAVALAHDPTPLIVDATDTDWTKDRDKLTTAGIEVQELCPDYIQERLAARE